jgi:signal transduction histidine kinase
MIRHAQSGNPAAILFVEDNEDLRANAALVLELEGYTVRVAKDGHEALEILENGFVPNLIVSDIMMPRMDGYEFFRAVRQKKHLTVVPFIFLTARGSRRDISASRLLGADDYLVKPFDPEEFLIAIQTRLQRVAELRATVDEDLQDARRTLVELLSHELRTPLTYVTGGFALLAEEIRRQSPQNANEDAMAGLDLIQSGTQRLNRLAEQMVLYSQILSGMTAHRITIYGDDLELPFLIADALALVGALARERGMIIHQIAPENERPVVYGVRDLLVTAISEVLRNAIQYSPPGSEINLIMATDGDFAQLTITDPGIGILPENQATIWDVMIQSERDRQEQQGAGMGLPIVKGVITAHGGEIDLRSAPGEGTQVTLRLPLATPC